MSVTRIICEDCGLPMTLCACGRLQGPSELAPSELPAPQGSLRCDGVVGLLRADLIAVMTEVHDESIKADWARDEYSHNRQRIPAAEARGRQRALSEVYTKLVGILVAESVRQQQPNVRLSVPVDEQIL